VTTRLHALWAEFGQSAWLDNLDRRALTSGELDRWLGLGIRGITSNPTIFAKAMSSSDAYDAELRAAVAAGASVEQAYWQLACADVAAAADRLLPLYEESGGVDGYVSIEVDPTLARETAATIGAARDLVATLHRPNIHIKVPATVEGLPVITELIAAGINVNVTLIFGLDRYEAVMEAYLRGLERHEGDLSSLASVASFFISRVDSEVDARLDALGTADAAAARGTAAVAQAQVAYQRFLSTFAGPRWEALARRGARVQRPLWASTSTKNKAYPDTLYVDTLIGSDTVNTLPEVTIDAFLDHGTLARTIDAASARAHADLARLTALGVDMDAVSTKLEDEGVAAFSKSFEEVIATLQRKVEDLAG
jgi:transaldolase